MIGRTTCGTSFKEFGEIREDTPMFRGYEHELKINMNINIHMYMRS